MRTIDGELRGQAAAQVVDRSMKTTRRNDGAELKCEKEWKGLYN